MRSSESVPLSRVESNRYKTGNGTSMTHTPYSTTPSRTTPLTLLSDSLVRSLSTAPLGGESQHKPNKKNMKRKYNNMMGLAAAACMLLVMSAANAAVTITITESGSDVVATGAGTINMNGLTLLAPGGPAALTLPSSSVLVLGQGGSNIYTPASNPNSGLGPGAAMVDATSASGMNFGMGGGGVMFVDMNYVSGTEFTTSATWANASLASLGLTPGTYQYSWGSGADIDTLTVNIIPEPSTALLGILGSLALLRRRR